MKTYTGQTGTTFRRVGGDFVTDTVGGEISNGSLVNVCKCLGIWCCELFGSHWYSIDFYAAAGEQRESLVSPSSRKKGHELLFLAPEIHNDIISSCPSPLNCYWLCSGFTC